MGDLLRMYTTVWYTFAHKSLGSPFPLKHASSHPYNATVLPFYHSLLLRTLANSKLPLNPIIPAIIHEWSVNKFITTINTQGLYFASTLPFCKNFRGRHLNTFSFTFLSSMVSLQPLIWFTISVTLLQKSWTPSWYFIDKLPNSFHKICNLMVSWNSSFRTFQAVLVLLTLKIMRKIDLLTPC